MNRELATQIAIAARVLAQSGLTAAIGNHVSVADGDRMYVNAFGPSLASLLPDDIVVTDLDGKVLEGNGVVNSTILLHGILHRRVPRARALIHTHSPAALTLGALRVVPAIYDQESCLLDGDIALHEESYSGPPTSDARVTPLAATLIDANAILLPNHGSLTAGEDLFMATLRMLRLEAMCRRHIDVHQAAAALGQGTTPRPISPEIVTQTYQELIALAKKFAVGDLYWKTWREQVRSADPQFDQTFK